MDESARWSSLCRLQEQTSVSFNFMRGFAMQLRSAWAFGTLLSVSLCGSKLYAEVPIAGMDDPTRIPGQYIVRLKTDANLRSADKEVQRSFVRSRAFSMLEGSNARLFRSYGGKLNGFAVKASAQSIRMLAKNPDVEWIEADKTIYLSNLQSNATWGLDRIDARKGLDSSYSWTASGTGAHAYIIDTGLKSTHVEFAGRVGDGFSSVSDGRGTEDCNGHGTHVTGTIGGKNYGVAKDVTVHPVRVFGCSGSTTNSAILAGIDWVVDNAEKPAVVNMSLGGSLSTALNRAVQEMIDAGISVVVAAGNSNANACNSSPAALPAAITVGSTTSTDARSSFSNFGRCLDIFAPGSSILSAWFNSNTATQTISGTSMASPHVAGAVALLYEENPEASPAEITRLLLKQATPNVVTSPGANSSNLLLYSLPASN